MNVLAKGQSVIVSPQREIEFIDRTMVRLRFAIVSLIRTQYVLLEGEVSSRGWRDTCPGGAGLTGTKSGGGSGLFAVSKL